MSRGRTCGNLVRTWIDSCGCFAWCWCVWKELCACQIGGPTGVFSRCVAPLWPRVRGAIGAQSVRALWIRAHAHTQDTITGYARAHTHTPDSIISQLGRWQRLAAGAEESIRSRYALCGDGGVTAVAVAAECEDVAGGWLGAILRVRRGRNL